jgi:hypothetical protein
MRRDDELNRTCASMFDWPLELGFLFAGSFRRAILCVAANLASEIRPGSKGFFAETSDFESFHIPEGSIGSTARRGDIISLS